jgi:hypothetical protein
MGSLQVRSSGTEAESVGVRPTLTVDRADRGADSERQGEQARIMNDEFRAIKKELIKYYHAWDCMEYDDPDPLPDPDPPPQEVVDRLAAFVSRHPDYPDGLDHLASVQLLTGNRSAGLETLKRILALLTCPHFQYHYE